MCNSKQLDAQNKLFSYTAKLISPEWPSDGVKARAPKAKTTAKAIGIKAKAKAKAKAKDLTSKAKAKAEDLTSSPRP